MVANMGVTASAVLAGCPSALEGVRAGRLGASSHDGRARRGRQGPAWPGAD